MNRAVILAAAVTLALAGCNTVSGLGQDMQVLGGAVSDRASDLAGSGKTSAGTDCTMDAHGRPQGPGCHPPLTDNPPPLKAPE